MRSVDACTHPCLPACLQEYRDVTLNGSVAQMYQVRMPARARAHACMHACSPLAAKTVLHQHALSSIPVGMKAKT